MQTHEIPSKEWEPYLDQFSQLHRGDRLDLEKVGGGTGPGSKICRSPLVRVQAQNGGPGKRIEVAAGDQSHPETHTIDQPTQLSVTEMDNGFPVALQITCDDGSVTSLRFEPPGRSDKPPEAFLG